MGWIEDQMRAEMAEKKPLPKPATIEEIAEFWGLPADMMLDLMTDTETHRALGGSGAPGDLDALRRHPRHAEIRRELIEASEEVRRRR